MPLAADHGCAPPGRREGNDSPGAASQPNEAQPRNPSTASTRHGVTLVHPSWSIRILLDDLEGDDERTRIDEGSTGRRTRSPGHGPLATCFDRVRRPAGPPAWGRGGDTGNRPGRPRDLVSTNQPRNASPSPPNTAPPPPIVTTRLARLSSQAPPETRLVSPRPAPGGGRQASRSR